MFSSSTRRIDHLSGALLTSSGTALRTIQPRLIDAPAKPGSLLAAVQKKAQGEAFSLTRQQQFDAFDAAHPEVYEAVVTWAAWVNAMRTPGSKGIAAIALLSLARMTVRVSIPNSFAPYYARKLVASDPARYGDLITLCALQTSRPDLFSALTHPTLRPPTHGEAEGATPDAIIPTTPGATRRAHGRSARPKRDAL